MGRRSRQRAAAGEQPAAPASTPAPTAPAAPAAPRTPRLHATIDERPPAPWHPVPLVELAILAGLIMLIAGVVVQGRSGTILVSGAIGLVALASLELTIREHITGYRSHSALLAGVVAVVLMAGLAFAGVNRVVVIAIAVLAGVLAFFALRNLFRRKAHGLSWRA